MLLGVLTLLVFILGFSGCQNGTNNNTDNNTDDNPAYSDPINGGNGGNNGGNEKTPDNPIEKDASSMDLGLDYKKYIDVKPIYSAYYDVDYEEVGGRFFASYVFENTDIIKNQEN